MKTKMIGLVVITLALLMSVGMASAVRGNYDVTAKVSVFSGFAVQEVEVGSWAHSEVTIGNYFVNATCLEPADYPIDKFDALNRFVWYDENVTGTGSVLAAASTTYDPTGQYLTNTFALTVPVNTTKVVLVENVIPGIDLGYIQELAIATEGVVTAPLITGTTVEMQSCHNRIVKMDVLKSGMVNATANGQHSMVFHTVTVPEVEPAYDLSQYAAGKGGDIYFDWTFALPDC